MTSSSRWLLAAALLLNPAASYATQVSLPVEGATMNLGMTVQTQVILNENGAPDGNSTSFDIFIRRMRATINGDISKKLSYFFQVDNANFGKFGNYAGRAVVQDAWVAFAPMGRNADTVVFLEGGILFLPFSRQTLTSITNQPDVEGHPDLARGFGAGYTANRSTGAGFRGWTLGKKIGFRGVVLEGNQPSAATPTLNPKRHPAAALFANFDLVGSEEGNWLYQSLYWAKAPILSLSVAGTYQSLAYASLKGPTDQRSLVSTLFLDYPLSEDQEVNMLVTGYRYNNGISKDTGNGFAADLGFRYKFIRPFVAWEYFNADDCPNDGSATAAQCADLHTADVRNFRAGFDLYFNKDLNHLVVEASLNRGLSSWGQQSVPSTPAQPAAKVLTDLGRTPSKSLVLHWNYRF